MAYVSMARMRKDARRAAKGLPPLAQPKPRARTAETEAGEDMPARKARRRRAVGAPKLSLRMIWSPEYAEPGGRHSWELTEAREREGQEPYPVGWKCRTCGMVKRRGYDLAVKYTLENDRVTYAWTGRVPKCSADLLRAMGERFGDAPTNNGA